MLFLLCTRSVSSPFLFHRDAFVSSFLSSSSKLTSHPPSLLLSFIPFLSFSTFRLDGELEPVSPIQQPPRKLSRIRTLARSSRIETERLAKTWNSVGSEDVRRRTRSLSRFRRTLSFLFACFLTRSFVYLTHSLFTTISPFARPLLSLSLAFSLYFVRSFLRPHSLSLSSRSRTLYLFVPLLPISLSTHILSLPLCIAPSRTHARVSTPHVLRCFPPPRFHFIVGSRSCLFSMPLNLNGSSSTDRRTGWGKSLKRVDE